MAEIKPLAGMERQALSEVLPLETPYAAYIFPTNLCNFKCSYCGHALGIKGMKQEYGIDLINMSMDTFRKVIDQLKEFPEKLKVISLTGHGEPLINPKLPDMIAYAHEQNVAERIEFISNASLLTHELSIALIEAGLDCIRISLQGLSAEKYQTVCGYAIDFEKFIGEIAYLYQNKKQCNVFVKIMDIALGAGEQDIFYNMFSDISDRMFVEQCKPVYSGVETTKDLQVEEDRYGRMHEPRLVCPLCFYMIGVMPNGDISPCETIYKPDVLGNVHEDTIWNMWNGKRRLEFQKMQLMKKRMENPGCARCCAPNDVAHPEDELDGYADSLLMAWGWNNVKTADSFGEIYQDLVEKNSKQLKE